MQCVAIVFSWTFEYPNIFVASKLYEYLQNEYICLTIFEYLNILEYLQYKNFKNSTNESPNIFVALKFNEYMDAWI